MAENLWELRKRRGMSVKQLASKAGIKPNSLYAYERGEPIRLSDLNRLAKALYVDASEIKIQSDPPTKASPPAPPPPEQAAPTVVEQPVETDKAPTRQDKPRKQKRLSKDREPGTVRPGQLEYLRTLWAKLGVEETAVVAELGKPLEELSYFEARGINGRYMQLWKENRAELSLRPPDTRRKRAHLPESVDEFENNYLQERVEAGEFVTFTFLNDKVFTGQVLGFSPYNINIRQRDGQEIVLNKMALAYYAVEAA